MDGKLYKSPFIFDYDFWQGHILAISDNCTVKKEIKIEFNNKEQADGYKGKCFFHG